MDSETVTNTRLEQMWEATKQRCTWKCSSCEQEPGHCKIFWSEDKKHSMPEQIRHEFHPHPLELDFGFFVCNACYGHFAGSSYSCRRCNFDLDITCALDLPGKPEDGSGLERHYSHRHLLAPVDSDDEEVKRGQDHAPCQICGQLCSLGGDTLGCKKCQFYIHAPCKEVLPLEIKRRFHGCTLFLLTVPPCKCDICRRDASGLCFYCGRCNFRLCLQCCLLIPADLFKSDGAKNAIPFKHFFHGHTLTLIEKPVRTLSCGACGRNNPDPIYACLSCNNFIVHVSCAKFPAEVKSYFHLAHSLRLDQISSLKSAGRTRPTCTQCCKPCDIAYRCYQCEICLDFECACLVPVVSYKRHEHLLQLMESLPIEGLECSACNKPLDCLPVFRCGPCNFNLHLQCGPLPITVETKYHVHQLQLLDYFVEDDRDDFRCHICEDTRDPLLCVYYCPDCDFVVHLKCVVTEITLVLKGKGGNVNLKTIGRHVPSELVDEELVVKQMEQSNTNQRSGEKYEVRYWDDLKAASASIPLELYLNVSDKFSVILAEIPGEEAVTQRRDKEDTFNYSDEELKRLMEELDSLGDAMPVNDPKAFPAAFLLHLEAYLKNHSRTVSVLDECQIPEHLVPVYNELFDKYGDICVHSSVTDPSMKSLYLCWICLILEDLRTTKVLHVTKSKIKDWWSSLICLRETGFDTRFILEHLMRLARAHFGVRAQHYIDDRTNELEGTIRDCSDEIERLKRELEKAQAKLQEASKQLGDHYSFVQSATTCSIKQCLKEGRMLKWRYAATGLVNVNGGP